MLNEGSDDRSPKDIAFPNAEQKSKNTRKATTAGKTQANQATTSVVNQ